MDRAALLNRIQRSGIRLAEVFNKEVFDSKLRRLASGYQKRYGDLLKYDVEDEIARFNEYRPKLRKYTVDAIAFMRDAQAKNTKILCEGANGKPDPLYQYSYSDVLTLLALMLDLDWGSVSQAYRSGSTLAALKTCNFVRVFVDFV